MPRTGIAAFSLTVIASSTLWAQGQAAAPAKTGAAAGFLGSDVCKTCHQDIWANFYKNPHFKSLAMGDRPPERTGCESCHGPAKEHVAARGGKTTIPHAFSLMTPKATLEACLSCHASDLGKANIQRSEHTLNGVACTSCHSIHRSAAPRFLLAKNQNEMCYTCHGNVRAQFEMPSRHRVDEGFMKCSDCHNPHGGFVTTSAMGQRPRMMERAQLVDSPCLNCHTDKRGPFVYEHPSVRVEGCQTCHMPHGSMNAKLLTRPVVFTVCLECHNGGASGTRVQGVDLMTPRHNLLDPKFQNCTTCHVRIHGSNADQFFLR
jgi:DmsE family decaheme c-type cytochrome